MVESPLSVPYYVYYLNEPFAHVGAASIHLQLKAVTLLCEQEVFTLRCCQFDSQLPHCVLEDGHT